MSKLAYTCARQAALALLAKLPDKYQYHSARHTIKEVVPAAAELAGVAQLSEQERKLLLTAAWFHDVGFIECPEDHEQASVRIARTILPLCGYTMDEVAHIADMILATRMPQQPVTRLAAILCDADLYVLGSNDFLVRNADLRAEQEARGTIWNDRTWYTSQLAFLGEHTYHTLQAQSLRDERKGLNIKLLQQRITPYVSIGR